MGIIMQKVVWKFAVRALNWHCSAFTLKLTGN